MDSLPWEFAGSESLGETVCNIVEHMETVRGPDSMDYETAAILIREEVETKFKLIGDFTKELELSRTTTHRILTGAPEVKPRILRDVERVLGWPRFTILAIREHRWEWLAENGLPEELVTRAQGLAAREAPGSRLDT
jgi:hypothetical protein